MVKSLILHRGDMMRKGSHITARHLQSERLMFYKVVEERETGLLRLLNLKSFYLMDGFKTKDPSKIIEYIENNLKCEVLKVSM